MEQLMSELTANPGLFKRGLKTHMDTVQVVRLLTDHMQGLPDLPSLKQDLELLNHMCNFLEELSNYSGLGLQKQDVIVDIYKSVYPGLTEDDITTLRKNIDYIHSIGRIHLRGNLKKYFRVIVQGLLKLGKYIASN